MWHAGLKVSWKSLVSIKSILKLIELVLALPVVTLTATFKTKTTVSCHEINETEDNNSYTIVYKSDFPYDYLRAYRDGDYLGIIEFDKDYGAIAQSFLAWGIITLIYCILAIFLYMMLSESQQWKYFERTTNIIYVADFGGSILWAIFWLAICVAWTIGSIQFEDFVKDHSHCVDDILYTGNRDDASFAQTYVAIGFGYMLVVLWTFSIWCAIKSTFIYHLIVTRSSSSRGGYEPI